MSTFKRNSAGIAKILRSPEVRTMVDDAAEKVAGEISAADRSIEPGVHAYETDRAAASVTVAGGAARQALDGIFTKACATHGIEVHG